MNRNYFLALIDEMLAYDVAPTRRMVCLNTLKRIYNEDTKITGETSDGYHTFNELYHHRAILFSVIVNIFKSKAWKSKKHADGTMFDNMFIVGINTPEGPATYHYDIDPYWDMFDCEELEKAPEWDGHTPTDAINRIASLRNATVDKEGNYVKKHWWNKWIGKNE